MSERVSQAYEVAGRTAERLAVKLRHSEAEVERLHGLLLGAANRLADLGALEEAKNLRTAAAGARGGPRCCGEAMAGPSGFGENDDWRCRKCGGTTAD